MMSLTRFGTRTRRPLALALLTVAAAALALALAPASPASAHDYLVSSSPEAGETVTKPVDEVKLAYDDVVLDLSGSGGSSIVQVTDADGKHFETRCPTTKGRDVTTPVALGGKGDYTVTWQIVSADGHTVSGDYAFHYAPPAGAEKAPGTASSACTDDDTTPGASADSAPPASPGVGDQVRRASSDDSGITGTVLAVVGIIFALIVVGVAVALLTARRRPRTPRHDPPPFEDEEEDEDRP